MELKPFQIITSSHDVLHDLHALKLYYRIYSRGCSELVPPVPVIHKSHVRSYFNDDLEFEFSEFEKTHPDAEYFLLDGSHRTTAADLTSNLCSVMLFESQDDIDSAKKMVENGELFQYMLGDDMYEVIQNLVDHFTEKGFFQTVDEKTKKLLLTFPEYMR